LPKFPNRPKLGERARALFADEHRDAQCVVQGTQGSGKTTFIATLDSYLTDISNMSDSNIKYYLEESGGSDDESIQGIKFAQIKLSEGLFPEKTPNRGAYIATAYLKFLERWGEAHVTTPIIEFSGEMTEKILRQFGTKQYNINKIVTLTGDEQSLVDEHIFDSDAVIYLSPVTRLVTVDGPLGDESEPDTVINSTDLNMMRFIRAVLTYKKDHPESRPLRCVFIVFSKVDNLLKGLKTAGFDLETDEGMNKFLRQFFRNTYNILDFNRINFHAYPFWVWADKDDKGKIIDYSKNGSKLYHVTIDRNTNRPWYSEKHLERLVRDIHDELTKEPPKR